jgi:hypothetical protein
MPDRQRTLLEDRSMTSRLATMTAVVALMFFMPSADYAQDMPATPPGPAQVTPPAAPDTATAQDIPPAPPGTVAPSAVDTKSDTYTQQKLDQILAPIALYPDQLVSQILMASTFPLQIVEAARWLDEPRNAALKGEALVSALQPMNWDPSVKSITAFPAIVKMLNKNLNWTNSLGVAFAHQQSDVMAQIQFLRHQAQKAGNLASNDKIVCRDDGANIVITPANPRVMYAPYYNPAVVYGTWPWAEYPPVYFWPGYYGFGRLGYDVAWAWGPAWPIVPAFWGWYGVNWGIGGGIYINGGGYSQIAYGNAAWGGGNWQNSGSTASRSGALGSVSSGGATRTSSFSGASGATRTSRVSGASGATRTSGVTRTSRVSGASGATRTGGGRSGGGGTHASGGRSGGGGTHASGGHSGGGGSGGGGGHSGGGSGGGGGHSGGGGGGGGHSGGGGGGGHHG